MNNQITLIGHVGQNPQIKTFGDTGNQVVKFSLAVKRVFIQYRRRKDYVDRRRCLERSR